MLTMNEALVISESVYQSVLRNLDARLATIKRHEKKWVYRISFALETNVDLVALLPTRQVDFSLFWRGRDQRQTRVALGAAKVIEGIDYKHSFDFASELLAAADTGVRLYGGVAFYSVAESAEAGEEWQKFSRCKMILPLFEVIEIDGKQSFTINLAVQGSGEFDSAVARVKTALEKGQQRTLKEQKFTNQLVSVEANPKLPGWQKQIEAALKEFKKGDLSKLVLSRRVDLTYQNAIDSIQVLQWLLKSRESAFVFYVQIAGSGAFLGRTPELLYSRSGSELRTEAIAGTQSLEKGQGSLIDSDKDQEEHAYVVKSLEQTLSQVCSSFESKEMNDLLKLDHIEHLYRAFNGRLKENTTDTDLISAFHPSPALGGYPRLKAKAKLKDIENFDRGWFGAPIGWLEKDQSEFVVAIRSARIRDNLISLFSGAGIIAASNAEKEWQELNEKLKTFSTILSFDAKQIH